MIVYLQLFRHIYIVASYRYECDLLQDANIEKFIQNFSFKRIQV